MASPRRQCEVRLPDYLVERLEQEPGGIQPILARVRREFGLVTSSSYLGTKNYVIIGPNPDILEMALETLKSRFFEQEEQLPDVIGQLDARRAIWRLHGDYGTKAAHLFRAELEELRHLPSVKVHIAPPSIEITCGYEQVEEVRERMGQLQADIDALHEEDIRVPAASGHMPALKRFIRRKHKYDRTVVCIWAGRAGVVTVYGKTEGSVKKILDEWSMMVQFGGSSTADITHSPVVSPRASQILDRKFRNELKIPGGIVEKLERQRVGIQTIINTVQKEFGLKISYIHRKHMTLYGPHIDILELAVQTLLHRYVLQTPPENGVLGQLQGRNAVWKFLGNYAKKVGHLFTKELSRLLKIKTVTVKFSPSRINPSCVEVLCSARVIEDVKAEVEKIVGLVHNLFEKEMVIPDETEDIKKTKHYVRTMSEMDKTILCLFDDKTRKLTVYGRNEGGVWHAISHVKEQERKEEAKRVLPKQYSHTFRNLYQTKISEQLVRKLLQVPGGIMHVIQRIEHEYEVTALFHGGNKRLVLISPSIDMLELAHDTLETRYTGNTGTRTSGSTPKKSVRFESVPSDSEQT